MKANVVEIIDAMDYASDDEMEMMDGIVAANNLGMECNAVVSCSTAQRYSLISCSFSPAHSASSQSFM